MIINPRPIFNGGLIQPPLKLGHWSFIKSHIYVITYPWRNPDACLANLSISKSNVIACRLFDAKPLSRPVLTYPQLGPYDQTFKKSVSNTLI